MDCQDERLSASITPVPSARSGDQTGNSHKEVSNGDGERLTTEHSGENVYHSPASRDTEEDVGRLANTSTPRDSIGGDAPAESGLPLPSDDVATAPPNETACRRGLSPPSEARSSITPDSGEILLTFATPEEGQSSVSPSALADGETAPRRLSDSPFRSFGVSSKSSSSGGTFGWSISLLNRLRLGKLQTARYAYVY